MVASNEATIGLAVQSAEGTPASASTARFFLAAGGLSANPQQEDVEETSATQVPNYAFRTMIEVGGEPATFMRPEIIGWLAYGILGAKAVSGAADPWTHTFTYAANPPFFTLWKALGGGLFEQYVDARFSMLRIESEASGLVRCTAAVRAKRVRSLTAAESAAVAESGQPYVHADGKGALLVEGTAVTRMQRASVEINRNVSAEYGDDVVPAEVPVGKCEITVVTREVITNFDYYNRMVYGSASPAANAEATRNVLELAGAPAGMSWKYTRQAAPERSVTINVPRVVATGLGGYDPNPSGEPIRGEHTYRGYDPGGAVSPVTIIVKNAKATYT